MVVNRALTLKASRNGAGIHWGFTPQNGAKRPGIYRGLEQNNTAPIFLRGDGFQVCLPLQKEVNYRKLWIPLPSHELYFCLWQTGVYSQR